MPILVRNITLGLDQSVENLPRLAAKKLRVPESAVRQWAPVRRSLDARKKSDIHFVYHVELVLDETPQQEARRIARLHRTDATMIDARPRPQPEPGHTPLAHRPVIVGFGPAGMFAALRLAEFGYQPLVLERGQPIRERHRDVMQRYYRLRDFDPESNLLFGEGGAGTYSDGKLYTRVHDPLVREVLETLFRHGAPPTTLLDAKPHVGSDKLPTICRNIRRRIESLGGEIRFGHKVNDFIIDDGRLTALIANDARLPTGPVLLGIGHSARDTVQLLHERGVKLSAKPFQLGVRIEHPQELVNRWQYGALASDSRLPPAEYQLVAKKAAGANRDMFSFCMCPGGTILPTNESAGLIATNGGSRSTRSGAFANAGLVITIGTEAIDNDPLKGLALLKGLESKAYDLTGGTYNVPAQRAGDFLNDRMSDGQLTTTFPLGGRWAMIRTILPEEVVTAIKRGLQTLDTRLQGFAGQDALVTAPETRASAPVRIDRHPESRRSVSIANLYPIGEGAGYAGGIVSAAIDGIKTANTLIAQYRPP